MNDLRLCAWEGFNCYDHLRVVDGMNDFGSWTQVFRCYERLKVMDDMNDSSSWA